MKTNLLKTVTLIFCFIFLQLQKTNAQCGTVISTFPYVENFDASNGGWTTGGVFNDWAWGAPNKANITNAGSGTKCWVTGGLTGSQYTNCERSYVMSPCFDFSSLNYPYVQLKVYWESEYKYDGAVFQYSLDGGITWANVGTSADPVNCLNANWFNYNNILQLGSGNGTCAGSNIMATVKEGWCGNSYATSGNCQGGNGSLGWVTAKHCMSNLAGQQSVRFRFAFGAGDQCNAYDGFAFDSISIGNAPTNVANFTFACTGGNTVAFTNTANMCPSGYTWNFGDPTSGAVNNSSTLANPTHTYSGSGSFTVTLTSNGPCNAPSTVTKTVKIMTVGVVNSSPSCNGGSNGTVTVSTINATAPISYTLNPSGATNTTGNFTGLSANTYTITVSDANSCSQTITTVMSQPSAIVPQIQNSSTVYLCAGASNGIINCTATGGAGSYTYKLMPNNSSNTSGNFTNLSTGTYTITVTDANSCSQTISYTISTSSGLNISSITPTNIACNGLANGKIVTTIAGGISPFNYQLLPINQTNNTGSFSNLSANTFTLTVTDSHNCTASSTTIITEPTAMKFTNFTVTDIVCNGQTNGGINCTATGGTGTITYNLLPNNTSQSTGLYTSLLPNTYTITASDANNCSLQSTAVVKLLNNPMYNQFITTDIGCLGVNNDGSATAVVTGGTTPYSYIWNGNSAYNTATISNLVAGQYAVLITDANNCTLLDTATINGGKCCDAIFIPSSFSPNGDQINDYFFIRSFISLSIQQFEIYNRFGQVVWKTNDINARWNGTFFNNGQDCDLGTYYYIFKYKCLSTNKDYVLKGDITLIR